MLPGRDGFRTVVRTPVRTSLFLIVLSALTVLISLALIVYASVSRYLTECDKNYHTIAVLEYYGENYPDSRAWDADMEASIRENKETWDRIRALPGVLGYEAEKVSLAIAPDVQRKDSFVYDDSLAVMQIRISTVQGENEYTARVNQVLYSQRECLNKLVFIESDLDLKEDQFYWACGHYIEGNNNHYHLYLEDMTVNVGDRTVTVPAAQDSADPGNVYESSENVAPYLALAQVIRHWNDGFRFRLTGNLAQLRPWQQKELTLTEGRLFTEEEYRSQAKVCIVSELLFLRSQYQMGDRIPLSVNTYEGSAFGSLDPTLAETEEYEIIGVYQKIDEYPDFIYAPAPEGESAVTMVNGYTLGQFFLENTKGKAFYAAAREWLPENYQLTFLDEGYNDIAEAYTQLQRYSILFLTVCLLLLPALLLVFCDLFVYRRREVAQLQQALGAGKGYTYRYFFSATAVIGIPAVMVGTVFGKILEAGTVQTVLRLAGRLQESDTRYSHGNIYVLREFAFQPVGGILPYLVTAVVILLSLGLFTALYIRKSLRSPTDTRPKKKTVKAHVRKPASVLPWDNFVFRSMRRGGVRTVAVVLLCAAIAAFFLQLTSVSEQYRMQLQTLEETASIRGYCTDYLGRYMDGTVVTQERVQKLMECDALTKVGITYEATHARFLGISRTKDGTEREVPFPQIPGGSFALETFRDKLAKEPCILATNHLSMAPQFYYEKTPQLTWYQDHHEEDLAGYTRKDAFVCVLPDTYLEREGISLGDTVRLFFTWSDSFAVLDLVVIGSYVLNSGMETIYTPLLQWTSWENPRLSYRSCTFQLTSAASLEQVREYLSKVPFSEARKLGSNRFYVLLDDTDYLTQKKALEQQMQYTGVIYRFLYIVAMLTGWVTAFLLLNARKDEMILIQMLGADKRTFYGIFLAEQAILSVFGAVLGILFGFVCGKPVSGQNLLLIVLFLLCWMLGTALRLMKCRNELKTHMWAEVE